MEIEFDVKINANILYDYMLQHTYSRLPGIMGTFVGVLLLFLFGANRQPLILLIALVVLLYLPWTLFLRAASQAKGNPAFQKPLHYRLTEEGIEVSQDDTTEKMGWENMVRALSTPKSIVVYTTAVNACIFPKADLGEKKYKAIEIISTHMPPKKVKIRG
ncbi:MAG: YcxB family protein [Bacteroidales bacterium]|nr:YcxB family protein [Bacteroidales bacterium]MCM1416538.1 YcxB family protein [bacterium]MCM1424810.1 YcxB family protein [bacterium]